MIPDDTGLIWGAVCTIEGRGALMALVLRYFTTHDTPLIVQCLPCDIP
jgi:hypothetical protein